MCISGLRFNWPMRRPSSTVSSKRFWSSTRFILDDRARFDERALAFRS